MSKDQDNGPTMSEGDLNLARQAGWELTDNPLSADELHKFFDMPATPKLPTDYQLVPQAPDDEMCLREHRSNAMYYAALLRPDTQEVFQDNEIEKAIADAKRIFRYIWEGQ